MRGAADRHWVGKMQQMIAAQKSSRVQRRTTIVGHFHIGLRANLRSRRRRRALQSSRTSVLGTGPRVHRVHALAVLRVSSGTKRTSEPHRDLQEMETVKIELKGRTAKEASSVIFTTESGSACDRDDEEEFWEAAVLPCWAPAPEYIEYGL